MGIRKIGLLIGAIVCMGACTSGVKKDPEYSAALKGQPSGIRSASTIISQDEQRCLDREEKIVPLLKLRSEIISEEDSIRGKIYFSSGSLHKLAKCNQLDYKISVTFYDLNRKIFFSGIELEADTIDFVIPYDSLKKLSETKFLGSYLIRGVMTASFFKQGEVLGYDTSLVFNRNVWVAKK